ncbi:MAG: hypothetical protein Q7T66_07525 [Herminiimonas sp.]|uniref:hypothetical protein n=1 Tax=Herminiimonas sp. TaxID=1926289 RepID=UPI0027249FE8|nr:hypothetical protein [Herminiimonas sp.]MDO9420495.1 hypothetical protein [Herminiimonas sp.]
MDKLQTQVFSRARPIRLAFFIDLTEASHPIIDAIFEYCYSIWGGRFSLIIPCENGAPIPEFLPWLKAFDPDVIYSYVEISEPKQQELHSTFYPSALQHHRFGNGDADHINRIPNISISPLVVETILPIVGVGPFGGIRDNRIIGAIGRMETDRFLGDSFGAPRPQLRNAMQNMLADYGSMLLVIGDDEAQPRQHHIRNNEITLPDSNSLLMQMAANRQIRGVAQLSAFSAPRLDLHSAHWGNSFNIVISDTVSDRVLYWNARSLMPAWRDGNDVDLCIPRANFNDQPFVASLREFLNRRNYVSGNNNGGPHRVTLRSVSIQNEELQIIAEQMRQGQSWNTYNHENIRRVADCIPEQQALDRANFTNGQQGFHSPKLWVESFSIGNELRLTAKEPEHLRQIPPSLFNPAMGAWAIDLDIERNLDHSPYSNLSHRWRLPRRLRVTQAFLNHYQISQPHGEVVGPRVSAGGLLTLYTTANVDPPKINLPTDREAIVTGLQSGNDWMPFHRQDQGIPPQLCHQANRSSAGRHFWGVYQLFGGMNKARSFFLHEFWRKQLESYGATDQRTDIRKAKMQAELIRRIGRHQLDLANNEQLNTLSDIVLKESDAVRIRVRSLDWTTFEKDFKALTERYNIANPSHDPNHNQEEEDRWNAQALRESVENLCELGVLHQGYEHKCRKCLHRSWISIADLKANIVCEVCHDVRPAPVSKAWQFRLNGFLREALQLHGVGPLFWVLSRYQKNNSNSFWFEGPLDIFFDQETATAGTPETDIDLTMIDNGLVRMCEVKQSERHFDAAAVARTMKKLHPDIAVIAIMQANSPVLQRKFDQFSVALAGTGIKPELLTLDVQRDIKDSPYF